MKNYYAKGLKFLNAVFIAVLFLSFLHSTTAVDVSRIIPNQEGVGLLPPSPFYFFKSIGYAFERFFTFDKDQRALDSWRKLKIQLAEIDHIRTRKERSGIIAKALDNFARAIAIVSNDFQRASLNDDVKSKFAYEGWMMASYIDEWQAALEKEKKSYDADVVVGKLRAASDALVSLEAENLNVTRAHGTGQFALYPGSFEPANVSLGEWAVLFDIFNRITAPTLNERVIFLLDIAADAHLSISGKDADAVLSSIPQSRLSATISLLDTIREFIPGVDEKNEANLLRQKTFQIFAGAAISSQTSMRYFEEAKRIEAEIINFIRVHEGAVPDSILQNLQRMRFNIDQAQNFSNNQDWNGVFSQSSSALGLGVITLWQLRHLSKDALLQEIARVKSDFDAIVEVIKGRNDFEKQKVELSKIENLIVTASDSIAKNQLQKAMFTMMTVKFGLGNLLEL